MLGRKSRSHILPFGAIQESSGFPSRPWMAMMLRLRSAASSKRINKQLTRRWIVHQMLFLAIQNGVGDPRDRLSWLESVLERRWGQFWPRSVLSECIPSKGKWWPIRAISVFWEEGWRRRTKCNTSWPWAIASQTEMQHTYLVLYTL